jgi:glycosyltransferase involved in cell wall biosynthesis
VNIGIVGLFPADANTVFSGPMRVVTELSLALSRFDRVDVTLVRATRFRNLFQPVVRSEKDGMKIDTVSYPHLLPYLKSRTEIDILNVHGVSFFNWMAVSGTRQSRPVQSVWTAHGFIPLERRFGFGHSAFKGLLEKSLARKSRHITTVSTQTRKLLTDAFSVPAERIEVIGNGVDTIYFHPLGRGPSPDPSVHILFVGSILPIKGIAFLLHALNRLKHLPLTLHLIGQATPYLETLKSMFQGLFTEGRVLFEGPKQQEELRKAYAQADIFVLTSEYDQYPQVVLEACAMGLPVIISDRVGVRAVLQEGREGFIVPYGDVEALADKIGLLISDPILRLGLGKNARSKAEKNSWSRIASSYLEYFTRILGQKAQQIH